MAEIYICICVFIFVAGASVQKISAKVWRVISAKIKHKNLGRSFFLGRVNFTPQTFLRVNLTPQILYFTPQIL